MVKERTMLVPKTLSKDKHSNLSFQTFHVCNSCPFVTYGKSDSITTNKFMTRHQWDVYCTSPLPVETAKKLLFRKKISDKCQKRPVIYNKSRTHWSLKKQHKIETSQNKTIAFSTLQATRRGVLNKF